MGEKSMAPKSTTRMVRLPISKIILGYLQSLAFIRREAMCKCIQRTLVMGLIAQMKPKRLVHLEKGLEKKENKHEK